MSAAGDRNAAWSSRMPEKNVCLPGTFFVFVFLGGGFAFFFLVSVDFITRKICQQSRSLFFSVSGCCFCSSLVIFFLILYSDLSVGLITRKICQQSRNFFSVVVAVFVLFLFSSSSSSSSSYILIFCWLNNSQNLPKKP